MRSLVVFLAVCAAASASHVLLDPHGRPLEPAAVLAARALHLQAKALEHAPVAYAAPVHYAAPAAVSHQSRVDVHSSPALLAYSAPAYHHALAAPAHYLKKRSLAVGHYAYAAPAAVSHQSRVDVVSSPAVAHVAYSAPHVAYAAPVHYAAPAAVSHQSRVDVHSSPAVVAYAAAPLHNAYSHGYYGHYLKKRSLALAPVAYAAPSAVSHQSRVDVVSSPAVVAHAVAPVYHAAAPVYHVAPAAVSHQSRVDVRSSPVHHGYAPLAHSYALHSAPLAYSSPLVHAW
ncbi:hypothetical protein JYU34_021209 [Plutella xylostella]|uniref:Cuticular protein n=1 Tax=Plutella xylostella TaxID=51655 RepID=A0ABQ7PT10_PLUXY|nr:hypothetical protein JYU34_021209 [Plutella xylostella]